MKKTLVLSFLFFAAFFISTFETKAATIPLPDENYAIVALTTDNF
jgi:hypothetical protein